MIAAPPTITGCRVTLRPYAAGFSETELQALYRWARDPEVLALAGGTALEMPYARFRELFLAQLPQRNSATEQLFAVLDEQGEMIGRAGLFGLDRRTRTGELGIVIGEPSRWGQGYGRDAVAALVTFAFEHLGLERIVLHTFLENERARRAFEAAGFQVVRQLERFSLERGTHLELEMEIRASKK